MRTDGIPEMMAGKAAVLVDLFHTLTALEITDPGGVSTSESLGVSSEVWHSQLLEKTPGRMTGEMRDPYEIMTVMARGVDPSLSDEAIRQVADRRMKRFAGALTGMPAESVEAMRMLKDAGKKTALVSNADVTEIVAWNDAPAAPYFDAAVFSCDIGHVKPDPEIYEAALERLGVTAAEAVFVGDGACNELEGARKVGLTTVMMAGVLRRFAPHKIEQRQQHADYVVYDLRDLLGPGR